MGALTAMLIFVKKHTHNYNNNLKVLRKSLHMDISINDKQPKLLLVINLILHLVYHFMAEYFLQ